MRIKELEVYVLAVPYVPAVRKYRPTEHVERPDAVVRVWTSDDAYGIGECGRDGDVDEVRTQFATIVGQDPLDLSPESYQYGLMQALYDLQGKALGWPLHRLLGRKVRDKVPTAYWTTDTTPEDTAAEAEAAVRLGFKVFKWKAWTPGTVVARVKATHEAVGDKIALRLDPNMTWANPATAIRICKQIAAYNIECLEDPFPRSNPYWYRILREKTDIPLAWHIGSPEEALRAAKTEGVDYLNVGGSPSIVASIAAIAEAAGIPIWLQTAGLNLGLACAYAAHIGAVTKVATLPADNLHFLKEHDILKPHLEVEDGFVQVPEKPGIGVELDMEAVKRYQIA